MTSPCQENGGTTNHPMKGIKVKLTRTVLRSVLLNVFLGAAAFVVAQDTPPAENVQYKWAFVARGGEAGKRQVGVVTKDTSMATGDEFKLFVNCAKPAYVYVVHKSSRNEVTLLFPYDLGMFEKDFKLDKNYYIPKGREWFKLDKNTGIETFYILASSERLTDLEKNLQSFFNAPAEKKSDAAALVVNEIKDIKKRFRTFSTLAERPISIAGNVRGEQTRAIDPDRVDIATLATDVSANNFFTKTITIDHK